MHVIITNPRWGKTVSLNISGIKLASATLLASIFLMLISTTLYHWVFLKGAREGWPFFSTALKWVVQDEFAQRDRYMRENLDAMAKRLGEVQAKLIEIESLGERVSGMAGLKPTDLKSPPAQGGVLVDDKPLSADNLATSLVEADQLSQRQLDWLTVIESRLFDQKLKQAMLPTQAPIPGARLGSPFGWRIDPFTGHSALHTGLDFEAPIGTPVEAAAGGIVITNEPLNGYGNAVEIDHGNGLVTRYAHLSRSFVKKGDLIKRGQKIAAVGSTGRSTGPHLHFEVLFNGVHQDPERFLNHNAIAKNS